MKKSYDSGQTLSLFKWISVLALIAGSLTAAPFSGKIQFTQPDGTRIELLGEGDEFYAVFESLDGYTVVFDPAQKTYFYASLSLDKTTLVPTVLAVGKGNPETLGLAKHLRISAEARQAQAKARQEKWNRETGVSKRWKDLKTFRQAEEAQRQIQTNEVAQNQPTNSAAASTNEPVAAE